MPTADSDEVKRLAEGPRNMAEAYIAYERYITEEWAPLLRELLRAKRDAILKDKDQEP